jgi:hypothetical protein
MAEFLYEPPTASQLKALNRPCKPEDTAVQDGMLQYFNEATKLTDWYQTLETDRTPFDYKWYYRPRKQ